MVLRRAQVCSNLPSRVDSGRCTGGVLGVLWWCSADLWGLFTPNPTWAAGKTRTSKKVGQFSQYASENGVDLPHVVKHAFGGQLGPNMQKAMLPWQCPSSRAGKLRSFWIIILCTSDPRLGPTWVIFPVCTLLAVFCGWYTIGWFRPHQDGYCKGNFIMTSPGLLRGSQGGR